MPRDPGGRIVWEAETSRLAVRLLPDALDTIEQLVMHGFKALPRRGAEIGGALYGRSVEVNGVRTVTVERVLPISCEYRSGPSFRLSDSDYLQLAADLGRVPEAPAGFFRSDTRPEFELTGDDRELLKRNFAVDGAVLLIKPVRTGVSEAKLYALCGGEPAPVDAGALPFGQRYGKAAEEAPAPERPRPAEMPRSPEPAPDRELPSARPLSFAKPAASRWRFPPLAQAGAAAAGLVLVGVLSYYGGRLSRAGRARPAAPAPVAYDARTLGFAVTSAAGQARVVWNAAHPAIRAAKFAALTIRDGADRSDLQLSSAQLRSGSLFYIPRTSDISFEFQVPSASGPLVQSARLILGTADRSAAEDAAGVPAQAPGVPIEAAAGPAAATTREWEAGARAAIFSVLKSWSRSARRGDAGAYAAHYAPIVRTYFKKSGVPRRDVEREIRGMLQRHGALRVYSVRPVSLRIVSPDRGTAVVRKRWRTAGPRVFAGEEEEELQLARRNGRWEIVSERETRVLWVRR
jgi:hypothetical protein